MDKKKILIIGGIVAVIGGIGFYMWSKNKKSADATGDATGGATGGATGNKSAEKPSEAPATETASAVAVPKPLSTRKDKKKACGRRPVLKKKRAEWQQCVDAGGVASFEGSDFDQWENDYMDFSGLDLDL
jgi:hypothetical protein